MELVRKNKTSNSSRAPGHDKKGKEGTRKDRERTRIERPRKNGKDMTRKKNSVNKRQERKGQ